jgi:hypothetical protein
MTRRDFIMVARTLRAAEATERVICSMADAIEDSCDGKAGFDRDLFIRNATPTRPTTRED